MKGIVWLNRNPDEDPLDMNAEAYEALPGFMGRPTKGVDLRVPWWIRLLLSWGRWGTIAIDLKALYEAFGEDWPPKHDPQYEDNSQFVEICLV